MANTNVQFKECDNCGKKTKGIWKCKGHIFCYVCYKRELNKMPHYKLQEE